MGAKPSGAGVARAEDAAALLGGTDAVIAWDGWCVRDEDEAVGAADEAAEHLHGRDRDVEDVRVAWDESLTIGGSCYMGWQRVVDRALPSMVTEL